MRNSFSVLLIHYRIIIQSRSLRLVRHVACLGKPTTHTISAGSHCKKYPWRSRRR